MQFIKIEDRLPTPEEGEIGVAFIWNWDDRGLERGAGTYHDDKFYTDAGDCEFEVLSVVAWIPLPYYPGLL